jgi:hypothetical protein
MLLSNALLVEGYMESTQNPEKGGLLQLGAMPEFSVHMLARSARL